MLADEADESFTTASGETLNDAIPLADKEGSETTSSTRYTATLPPLDVTSSDIAVVYRTFAVRTHCHVSLFPIKVLGAGCLTESTVY